MGDYIVWAATVINLSASIAYFTMGDNVRTVYWLGAFMLTGSTIFMGR